MNTTVDKNIAAYGLQVQHVLEDETGPAFSYSVGLFKSYMHPELIIIGLRQSLAHLLINNMATAIKNGKIYRPMILEAGILDGFNCSFIEVDKVNYHDYVGQAINYYGSEHFPLLQCIYPTVKGIYPWEEDWPAEISHLQPILGATDKL